MDAVHLHLMLTHVPIVGLLIAVPLLAYGLILKKNQVSRAALGLTVLLALVAVPVYLTGEGAEEVAEGLPGVTDAVIEAHEELAGVAIWITGAAGVLALLALVVPVLTRQPARLLSWLALLAALTAFGFMAKTGNLGGQIRHTEIRQGASGNALPAAPENGEYRRDREYDDD